MLCCVSLTVFANILNRSILRFFVFKNKSNKFTMSEHSSVHPKSNRFGKKLLALMSNHDHNHTGCDGDDRHDETPEMGIQYSLFKKIDSENLECLNEKVQHSGKEVFKAWENRLNTDKFVESDVDEELLFNIPFTGNIKLKGIIIIGGEGVTHPSKMRLFKNRPNMSFDDVAIESDQDFELHPDTTGTLEYSTKIVKFSSVHHLTIHIPKNFGGEVTKIYYIGLRGEFSEGHRHGVTICTYEARPNIADHKTDISESISNEVQ